MTYVKIDICYHQLFFVSIIENFKKTNETKTSVEKTQSVWEQYIALINYFFLKMISTSLQSRYLCLEESWTTYRISSIVLAGVLLFCKDKAYSFQYKDIRDLDILYCSIHSVMQEKFLGTKNLLPLKLSIYVFFIFVIIHKQNMNNICNKILC
ncbi:hypothetical protein RFI_28401 [Reticulomyxa filosa]|uniref:Uncharacterized protein n=1 Tax=Reticulomyxa filosa TaxID=46433 RepID=X6M5T2_RETFI|nr:hypothetical protein RFI_28401 [Reticulomyxa filosa]|eukprot:ETO08986.1 hypothetical protein RFI_28401 [Reticulomyxa filosa]